MSMTVWHIHILNSRGALTPVLSDVRTAAREAVSLASKQGDLPRFDLVIKAGREVIPEWGLAGHAPAPGLIDVTLNPDRFDAQLMIRTLVHEFHHLMRWDGPGYGRSLGDALVSEGLAGHFVLQVLGGKPDPWDATVPAQGLARQALNGWSRLDYDHARWFFGRGDIRKWAGYGLGHRLVAEYLAQHADKDAAALAEMTSEAFRPTMRRLVGAEGPEPDEIDDEADVTPAEDQPKAAPPDEETS